MNQTTFFDMDKGERVFIRITRRGDRNKEVVDGCGTWKEYEYKDVTRVEVITK